MMKSCSVTVDVDCLRSNFKGFGLKKPRYSFRELEIGTENILSFFSHYGIRATFFVVAQDVQTESNAKLVKRIFRSGHEIASHSLSHPQGFRLLPESERRLELQKSKAILEDVTGQPVIGFRAPGWNISDDTIPILRAFGYRYDSSVFPTMLMPLLKTMHYYSMRKRDLPTRTTLGHLYYMYAPTHPYHTDENALGKKGSI